MEGSFDNWTTRQPMQRSGKDFTIVKLLPPGVYQVPRSCPACGAARTLRSAAVAATALFGRCSVAPVGSGNLLN